MPFVSELKAGDHFISSGGEMFEVIAQGRDYAFTRKVSDGEEMLYAGNIGQVCLATKSQVQQAGRVAVVMSIIEDAQTIRQAAETAIDYLDAEVSALPKLLQELADKARERNTDAVRQQDDSYLDGILALAGASFAVAGSDTPNYKVKAARLWPWNHPKQYNETATQKFNRVFYADTPIKSFRDRLVWSAVLIMAEIEKHDRKWSLANDAKK
ncbi:hypothetical protein DIBBI_gp65 [Xanthomonas phage vB_XveM_DIBBI]|uniref:Uncharacterized protein n=1 Tax=Xanthomonas phage vB_XveM_DIBBI TaxID=1129194 RepID=I3PGZ8_9CAUD|nr:hypothetical protein DIBBI_gp65 [Xanthomonas phage vB_XveM_DIBBI]AEX65733.1 hypothetical protein DIBBI_065 [Xanthomonas phage vB_XveM_DIBBI]